MVHAAATVSGKNDPSEMVTAYVTSTNVSVPSNAARIPLDLIAIPSDLPIEVPEPDPGDDWSDTPSIVEPIEPDPGEEEPEELWMPDVWIEEIDSGLVVTQAPPAPDGKRLFGGDRVTTIDGAAVSSMEPWEALELLYGPKGSMCRITVERPASRETVSASLPRTKNAYEMDGHIY
jgi:hypothetical protein